MLVSLNPQKPQLSSKLFSYLYYKYCIYKRNSRCLKGCLRGGFFFFVCFGLANIPQWAKSRLQYPFKLYVISPNSLAPLIGDHISFWPHKQTFWPFVRFSSVLSVRYELCSKCFVYSILILDNSSLNIHMCSTSCISNFILSRLHCLTWLYMTM